MRAFFAVLNPPNQHVGGPVGPALLLLGGLILLGLFIGGWLWWSHRRRKASMQAFQRKLNLQNIPLEETSLRRVRELLEPFELPHNAEWSVQSIMAGDLGSASRLYVLGLRGDPFGRFVGKGELILTALLIHQPDLNLPKFLILPRNYLSRGLLGKERSTGIEFADPFSRYHRLVGTDPLALRRLFNLEVRHSLRNNRLFTIEGAGDRILIYRFPTRLNGLQAQAAVDQAVHFLQAIQYSHAQST